MNCGVGHSCRSDLALLWLWCTPAATTPVQPLAWEPPYAADVTLERQNKNKSQKTRNPVPGLCIHENLSWGSISLQRGLGEMSLGGQRSPGCNSVACFHGCSQTDCHSRFSKGSLLAAREQRQKDTWAKIPRSQGQEGLFLSPSHLLFLESSHPHSH